MGIGFYVGDAVLIRMIVSHEWQIRHSSKMMVLSFSNGGGVGGGHCFKSCPAGVPCHFTMKLSKLRTLRIISGKLIFCFVSQPMRIVMKLLEKTINHKSCQMLQVAVQLSRM